MRLPILSIPVGRIFLKALAAVAVIALAGCQPQSEEPAATPAPDDQAADETVSAQLAEADRLVMKEELAEGIALLEEINQENPGNADVLEALALAYMRQPDPELASFYFNAALEQDPDRTGLHLYAAGARKRAGDPSGAIEHYRAYLAENPENGVTRLTLANLLLEEERFDPALDAFIAAFEAIERPPRDGERFTIAELALQQGAMEVAEQFLEAPVQNSDKANVAAALRFRLAIAQENFERASQILSATPAVAAMPETAEARARLASAKESQTNKAEIAEAPADSTRERETIQTVDLGETGQASVYSSGKNGRPADTSSDEAFSEAEIINFDDTNLLTENVPDEVKQADQSGQTEAEPEPENSTDEEISVVPGKIIPSDEEVPFMTVGDVVAAARRAPPQTAATPAPSEPLSLAQQGRNALDRNDFGTAVVALRQAFANNPTAADLAFDLSRAHYFRGDYVDAELFAAEALRLQPDNERYMLNQLRALRRSVPPDQFMNALLQARQRFPANADIALALARGYDSILNDAEAARSSYERFLQLAPNHPRAPEVRRRIGI